MKYNLSFFIIICILSKGIHQSNLNIINKTILVDILARN